MSRPFYIIGHNPNTADLARQFIAGGANAIEPDVNVFKHDDGRLCISHGPGESDAIDVKTFFSVLSELASEYPHFCLVYLDCKPAVAAPSHMRALLDAVRRYLTVYDGSDLKVIFSLPSLLEAHKAFPAIASALRPNEGLMVDEENDPLAVARFFRRHNVTNQGYGNGDSVPLPTEPFFPHVEPSLKRACQLRDASAGSGPNWVIAWTFNTTANQEKLIDYGVDGIIVDLPDAVLPDGLGNIKELIKSKGIELATGEDPLSPSHPAAHLARSVEMAQPSVASIITQAKSLSKQIETESDAIAKLALLHPAAGAEAKFIGFKASTAHFTLSKKSHIYLNAKKAFEHAKEEAVKIVCRDLKYCKNKAGVSNWLSKHLSDIVQLLLKGAPKGIIAKTLELLGIGSASWASVVAIVVAWLLKAELDELCGCEAT